MTKEELVKSMREVMNKAREDSLKDWKIYKVVLGIIDNNTQHEATLKLIDLIIKAFEDGKENGDSLARFTPLEFHEWVDALD